MKKRLVFVLVLGLLLVPATIYAGLMLIPITNVVYNDLGDTSGVRSAGEIRITTLDLLGTGALNCGGDAACIATGLDGTFFDIRQDLRLVFSRSEGQGIAVTGRSLAELGLPPAAITLPDSAKFRGEVVGRARCAGVAPRRCQTLEVRMRVRGPVVDAESGIRAGRLNLQMTGTLTLRDGGKWGPAWTTLAANGTLGLLDNQ